MIHVENSDCTSGIIYFENAEMTNVEMLCQAPQDSERVLIFEPETHQWILRWTLKEVEIYRASAREAVRNAKPVSKILEIAG